MGWFGKKDEPKQAGDLTRRMADAQADRKMVEKCFPGGATAFDALLQKEPESAILKLMDSLAAKDMIGYVEPMAKAYWSKVPQESQIKVIAHLFDVMLRVERGLKNRGLEMETVYREDMERSERAAIDILRKQ